MLPLVALGLVQAGLGAVKGISGAIQASQAKKKLNSMHRPQMAIPQEAITALDNAKKMSLMTQLPGQDIMESRIGSGVQSNVNALGEVATGGSLLEGTNRAYQTGAKEITNLDLAGAQFNNSNQGAYRQELGQMAGLKNQQWNVNELQPYQQKYGEMTQQKDAGNANIWGGLGMAASAASSVMGMTQEQKLMDQYTGAQKGTQTFGSQPNSVQPMQKMGIQGTNFFSGNVNQIQQSPNIMGNYALGGNKMIGGNQPVNLMRPQQQPNIFSGDNWVQNLWMK